MGREVARLRALHRYALAIVATGVVVLIRVLLEGTLGHDTPFISFALAVTVAASLGGLGPGLTATALSAVSGLLLFGSSAWSDVAVPVSMSVRVGTFLVVGVAISLLSARMSRALVKSRKYAEALAASQAAQKESEAKYRALFDSNVVPLNFWHADGRIAEANDAYLRLIGFTREELEAGKVRWDTLTPDEYIELDRRAVEEMQRTGKHTPFEKEYVLRDGRRVPVMLGAALMPGASDRGLAFALDLSTLKRAEAALAAQLRLNKTITDNATAALFMVDARGYCTFMNPAAEAMIGYSFEETREQPLHEVIHHHRADGQRCPIEECALERALVELRGLRGYEDVFVRRSGEFFPVVCSASPTFEGGHAGCTVLEVRDVTEQKRIEEEREALLASERAARNEAVRASHLKDEFLAMLSHELRTPLNAILGWAQLLRRPGRAPKDIDNGLSVIERNARLQTQLISDLLDVTRIMAGKLHVDAQPVELPAIIEAALDSLRLTANTKGVEVRRAFEPGEWPVMGDAARLQQIVWNLISNAIKFTPKGGSVQVSLSREGTRAQLTVRDTGQGIAPEFLPMVFERFRQADSSAARRHGGLGLGLSIVKHLVDMHGGTIRAESEGVGKGSVFTVELPLMVLSAEQGPREDVSLLEVRNLRGVTVLVVDDEPDAREFVKRVLEECDAKVITVGSASEALDALAARMPDILVSDIGMPGMDGYALLREVRARKLGGVDGLPAVAVTAFARPEDRERALCAGYRSHLAKPLEPAQLVAVIANLSGSKRSDMGTN